MKRSLLLIGLIVASFGVLAQPNLGTALTDESLATLRGGFSGNGIDISFGIERAVYVNGALVASTSLNVAGGAAAALVQNGTGNLAAIAQTTAGTVIQNTLDGQKIQSVTTVNAAANSLSIYRNIDLGASMRGAVIDSLRH